MRNTVRLFVVCGICLGAMSVHAQDAAALRQKAKDLRKRWEEEKVKARATEKEFKDIEIQANLADLDDTLKSMKAVKPKQPRKLLIYSRTRGYRHQSIPFAVEAFKKLGEATGAFTVEATEDENVFATKDLNQFDGIMMLSTTGNDVVPKGDGQKAFEAFLSKEKGLIGIHAATDCNANWKNYREAMGGLFDGHPWGAGSKVTLFNEEPKHPVSEMVPQGYVIQDEIYQYKPDEHFTREKLRILVSLDLAGKGMKKGGMKRQDNDYAVSWVRKYDNSRVYYTNLGHNDFTFYDKVAMQHMLTGIQFALGDIKADCRPSAVAGNPKAKPLPEGFNK